VLSVGRRTKTAVVVSYLSDVANGDYVRLVEKRLKSIEYIRESLDAASVLGAETIVVHTGSASKITRDEAMKLAADTLIKTLSSVDTHGVKIGLETMGKINQLGTLDEVLELCRIDKAFVPVIDFGHLNARECGGVFKSADDYLRVFDKIDRLLGFDIACNLHCHFSKIEYKAGGEYKHLTFEDDFFGPEYEPLIDAIVKSNLTPTIICESAGTQAEDALSMKKYYESKI
jgi:deoxyribonuclease-4